MSPRRLILHVGLSKSGTTALQSVVATSRSELASHGVAVPLSTRPAVERVLLSPLGWRPGSGFVAPREPDPLARLLGCLRAAAERDVLISGEDLAELDGPTVRSVVALARSEGFEVQLIVTARAWTRQLPSEYQQFLKHRLADTFPDFLDSVRAGEGFYGQHFRQRQDLAQVCARWAADVRPQDMHVVVLPPNGEDRDFIFTEAAAILGVPPSVLPPQSSGRERLLRRSRGRGLPSPERRARPPAPRPHPTHLPLPPARAQPRCPETRCESADLAAPRPPRLGRCRVDAPGRRTRGQGYCIHGDPRWLLADARDTGSAPVISDEDLSRAAIETLARFAVRTVLSDAGTAAHDGDAGPSSRRWFPFPARIGLPRSRAFVRRFAHGRWFSPGAPGIGHDAGRAGARRLRVG